MPVRTYGFWVSLTKDEAKEVNRAAEAGGPAIERAAFWRSVILQHARKTLAESGDAEAVPKAKATVA